MDSMMIMSYEGSVQYRLYMVVYIIYGILVLHFLTNNQFQQSMERKNLPSKKTPGKYKYYPSMVKEVSALARFGLTNEEIAGFYGIAIQTFASYIRDIPELYASLEQGRMMDSMKVVDSLHKQALGYEVTETEISEHVVKGEIVELKKVVTKHVQPNVTAAIYLLKTRHGDKWMDVVKTEQTRNLNVLVKNVDFADVSTEDLLLLKKLGINRIPDEFKRPKQIVQENNPLIQDVRGN